jgi:EmrB/QacA subfamily drug resistance transporter
VSKRPRQQKQSADRIEPPAWTGPSEARTLEDAAATRRERRLIFITASSALFMASVDQTIVSTALGSIQRDLHTQVNWSSWTITIYALGQLLAMPLAGSISDRFSRKKVFVAAIVLFTVASVCCGLANNIYTLIVLRFVQSCGGGAFMPSATGIVSDTFGAERDRAIGLFTSIFPIGGLVGPVLGGMFVTYWSWRGIFFVNVPVGAVLTVVAIAVVPGHSRKRAGRIDLRGVALLGCALVGLMFGVSYLGENSLTVRTGWVLILPVVGVAALVLFVRHAARAPDPFVPIWLLVGRGFGVMNLINFALGSATLGFAALVPLYAEQRFGIKVLGAGSLLTARAVGITLVAAVAAFALRRTGYRLPMITGFLIIAIGLLLLASVPRFGLSDYVWLSVSAAVTGVGMGVAIPASNNATLRQAPENTAALAGLRGMFRQCGGITGVSIITTVVARSGNPGMAQAHAFVVYAGALLCLIPLVWLVPDHKGGW